MRVFTQKETSQDSGLVQVQAKSMTNSSEFDCVHTLFSLRLEAIDPNPTSLTKPK